MSERDTASVTLSKGEARKVIAALAEREGTETGRGSERLLNLQNHLASEFGFDEYRRQDEQSDVPDGQDALVGDDDLLEGNGVLNLGGEDEEIELSRTEAEDVLDALSGYDGSSEDEAVVADVRERLARKFD